ncbi:PREDICTED: interleukin-13 receptor subunit alpha-1, partial [Bison bison bison]|uniref:Interleukin-13 receptor subunit alpha-1 n=1 Tax=Bison bison bison TaxID=43346 RepID=A0A6P3G847_BISBB
CLVYFSKGFISHVFLFAFHFPGQKANQTFYITTLLIIPVIVAAAVIVLLLYLKRLKIIIFPPIPDPGKIFKEMFGDQNDDTLHWKKYDIYEKQTKEETDSVVLIESLKRASQ